MKRTLGILVAVAAVSVLIWVILESREGGPSSFASQPETPAPPQFPGASFTYNFDTTPWAVCQRSFIVRALGKEPKANGL